MRCKNLAVYIIDCVYLYLSDDTLKSFGPILSDVYARHAIPDPSQQAVVINDWQKCSVTEL